MKKMPCLFERDFQDRGSFTLLETVTPGCEWVMAGEGIATRKRDGTACMVKDGRLYKRYDAKRDRKTDEYKAPPEGAILCDDPDPTTGHWPHWVPVGAEPESKWHREAWKIATSFGDGFLSDGTYELCGPAINGNAEDRSEHGFFRHGAEVLSPPRTFDELGDFLRNRAIEGIVFHHPDGRMCKIRRHDYGFPWGSRQKSAERVGQPGTP